MGLFKRYLGVLKKTPSTKGDFLAGANWNNAARAGVFCVHANNAASNANANIGSRLVFYKIMTSLRSPRSKQALPLGKTYTFRNNGLVVLGESSIVENTRRTS